MTNRWTEAWREERTPWDAGASSPALIDLVTRGALPRGRALVAGCGSGYDVLTLAAPDRHVVGLDLAKEAVARFERLRDEAGIPTEQAEVRLESFFDFAPAEPFDLIWDYTFLCALDLDRREAWARKVESLLAPGGELAMLLFPVAPVHAEDRPPRPIPPDDVRPLLAGVGLEPTVLEPTELSHPPRRGNEWLGRFRRTGEHSP